MIPNYAYKPSLGQKTQKLAQNLNNGKEPIQERLISYKDVLKKKKEDLCQEHHNHVMAQCPFNPNLDRYGNKVPNVDPSKWDALHQRSYENPKQQRVDRTIDDIEIERNPDDFTFKPMRKEPGNLSPVKQVSVV